MQSRSLGGILLRFITLRQKDTTNRALQEAVNIAHPGLSEMFQDVKKTSYSVLKIFDLFDFCHMTCIFPQKNSHMTEVKNILKH